MNKKNTTWVILGLLLAFWFLFRRNASGAAPIVNTGGYIPPLTSTPSNPSKLPSIKGPDRLPDYINAGTNALKALGSLAGGLFGGSSGTSTQSSVSSPLSGLGKGLKDVASGIGSAIAWPFKQIGKLFSSTTQSEFDDEYYYLSGGATYNKSKSQDDFEQDLWDLSGGAFGSTLPVSSPGYNPSFFFDPDFSPSFSMDPYSDIPVYSGVGRPSGIAIGSPGAQEAIAWAQYNQNKAGGFDPSFSPILFPNNQSGYTPSTGSYNPIIGSAQYYGPTNYVPPTARSYDNSWLYDYSGGSSTGVPTGPVDYGVPPDFNWTPLGPYDWGTWEPIG